MVLLLLLVISCIIIITIISIIILMIIISSSGIGFLAASGERRTIFLSTSGVREGRVVVIPFFKVLQFDILAKFR